MALEVKNLSANAGDVRDGDWIPGSGRSPGEGNGDLLQYSCLENPMDRRAWGWGRLQSIGSQSWTLLKRLSMALAQVSTKIPFDMSSSDSVVL